MIELQDITFSYDAARVIDGVTFSIDDGEFVGVIGPNGSGKTTLLKLLSKVLRPHSGTIKIKGKDISRISSRELARTIAVVPQESNVLFPFTVREIVLMGRYPHLSALSFEHRQDIDIADETMRTTDVAQFADRLITEVSGGEKQRVIIARALAQQPAAMLLDEPTAFLDIRHQIDVHELLKSLNEKRRMTILCISHDLNLAARYCKRLILLDHGRVAADGSPTDVLTPDNILRVFGVNATVQHHPQSGAPVVLPDITTRRQ
jgi:iron complex transport system ATP-binding protein